jgi:3-hydroxybutyryl-CoA dehydrogenase
MEIRKVGVVGCGLMGGGIAQICAQSGFETVVREVSQELLDQGLRRIESILLRDVGKGKLDVAAKDAAMARLLPTTTLDAFADCEIVVEAIVERLDAKRELFAVIDQICPLTTIFASNTSSLTIIEIATATNRPDRFAGLHFFSPVPMMQLVEVVRSLATSDATIATLKDFGAALGKTVVEAKDTPGFIVNRLLVPFLIDAVRVLEAALPAARISMRVYSLAAATRLGRWHCSISLASTHATMSPTSCSKNSKSRALPRRRCSSAWCWPGSWGASRVKAFTTTRSQESVFRSQNRSRNNGSLISRLFIEYSEC